jgi:NADPH:quinone reductase-like Zn-dependent oxidoreductase
MSCSSGFTSRNSKESEVNMKALRFKEFGPPSVLTIEEIPQPAARESEALVQVKAAAINPSDVKNVSGHFSGTTLPRTPGRDFAGVVVKGKQYQGEEVWGSGPGLGITRDGAHAEYVVIPVEILSRKPQNLTLEQAAAIGVPFITAWAALVRAAELQAGETILIRPPPLETIPFENAVQAYGNVGHGKGRPKQVLTLSGS